MDRAEILLAKFCVQLVAIFVLLFLPVAVSGQSPQPQDWLLRVNEIRNAEGKRTEAKILELRGLMEEYLQRGNPKDSIYARMAHRLGDFYRIVPDFNGAITYFEIAEAINSSNSVYAEPKYLCETYCNLGLTYLEIDNKKAEEYFGKSLEIFRRYPEEKGFVAAIIQENRAAYFFGVGDYEKSVEVIEYAFATIPGAFESTSGKLLLLQKAYSLQQLGFTQESKKISTENIRYFESNDIDKDIRAVAYSIYSQFLEKDGRVSEARLYLEKCFELQQELNYSEQMANTLYMMGSLYVKISPGRARKYFQQAVDLVNRNKTMRLLPILYNGIGVAFQNEGSHIKALEYFQKGLLSMGLGFFDDDIFVNPGLAHFEQSTNSQFGVVLLKNKGESLLQHYKPTKQNQDFLTASFQTHLIADKLVDLMRWSQSGQLSKQYWRGRVKSLYETALETCYYLEDERFAFYFLEKSRAVLLNDKLNEIAATQSLSNEDAITEISLKSRIDELKNQIENSKTADPGRLAIVAELNDQQLKYQTFIKDIERKYPTYFQYKYDTAVIRLGEFQKRMELNQQDFVSYFFGEENIFMFKVDGKGVVFEMRPVSGLLDKLDRFNELIVNKNVLNLNYREFLSLSKQIYDDLVAPLRIESERVIFSMEERFIPFEALVTLDSDPESFLLKSLAISYTYSAQFLHKFHDNTDLVKPKIAGYAPVDFSNYQKTPLTGSAESVSRLGAFFPGSKLFLSQKASRDNFVNDFHKYPIVHVYSHAEAGFESGEHVIFFSDKMLRISEVPWESRPKTNLIVLSACNTGVGKAIKGEGVMSFARAFASIGIPSSMTTLWEVDDLATYAIDERFYKYLAEGYYSDVALQKAKLDFLNAQDKSNRIPYYWSGPILVGNVRRFEPSSSDFQIPFILIGVLIFLSIIIFISSKTGKLVKIGGTDTV